MDAMPKTMRQRRAEAIIAKQTTRVGLGGLKKLFKQCKGARLKSLLLQRASQTMGMDIMPNR
ncbi:hypothetical protein AB4Y38_43695, partial [Paraburkholderia sp. EG285A]|uniref:hypothetical protein n=1 Tax=Paraburkholderia sp. EG285A TaxID=3237009 RepID=UPI0034D2CF16